MSLFQKLLLAKYTKPIKVCDEESSAHHTTQSGSYTHIGANRSGFGDWLAHKLPAQALREFCSVTYEPPPIVSSDAVCLLHCDIDEAPHSFTDEAQATLQMSSGSSSSSLNAASKRKYRSEQEQWDLESRIARLKSPNKRSA